MWQVHHQKVDLLFDTANHGECLAKIRLSMARRMRQWHEHLPLTLLGREDIVLHNRDAAFKVMLITQSFKYPFRRVSLLLWNQLICLKGLINIPVNASNFGRRTGWLRRYPGGKENANILAMVRGSTPNTRAASRLLIPSIKTA